MAIQVKHGDRVRYNGYTTRADGNTIPAIETATVIGYDETMIYYEVNYSSGTDFRTQNAIWDENINICYGARRSSFHRSRLIEIIKPLKEIEIPKGLIQVELF